MDPAHAADGLVYSRIARRLMPLLVLLYVVAWLDRVNVGFAKLQMVADLRFSEAVYGFGAGIFYLGYLLFEIPSNLFLIRIGARRTLARIALLWGVTSIATMVVRTPASFYTLRFLLGAFEAGLYPGVVLYLTGWFPARRRARMLGWFMLAIPLAGLLGSPLSGWIMESTRGGAGLANWQWLFVVEGLPSIVLGLLTLVLLADSPSEARWLTDEERRLVAADLERDARAAGPREHAFLRAAAMPRVWLLALAYFCVVSANPTLAFWTPAIVKGFGVRSDFVVGLLAAVPYVVAMIAVVAVGASSDRTLERRYHTAACCAVAAGGLAIVGLFPDHHVTAFVALVAATAGVLSAFAPFWQMPTALLGGAAAAGGIALINSVGNLSGWLGPFAVGWLEDVTGRTSAGLYVVAGLEAAAVVLVLAAGSTSGARRVPPRPVNIR